MKTSTNIKVLGVLLILSSCMPSKNADRDPNVSPFNNNKVLVSKSLMNTMALESGGAVTTNTPIPAGTQFGFIVEDKCVIDRSAKVSRVKHFIDKYVDIEAMKKKLGTAMPESVIATTLNSGATFGALKQLVKLDPCIVGVSDLQKHNMNSATFSDPLYQAQLSSYLQKTGFIEAEAFFKANIPESVKVNVAVIDSGFDLVNGDIRNITTNLEGLNIFDQNSNPQDTLGHGTQVAHIIAAEGNSKGGVGIASRNTTLIPVRAFKNESIEVTDAYIFDSIKRAVNAGAEIINMSFSAIIDREGIIHDKTLQGQAYVDERENDKALVCSPLIGHAIYRGIQRKVFFTMAAGHGTSFEKYLDGPNRGKWKRFKRINNELVLCAPTENCTERKKVPGSLMIPHDTGGEFFGNNSVPGCWSRHYEGAVSVAALDANSDALAAFSNWGSDGIFRNDGVEIAAPGAGVLTLGLNGQSEVTQGTSFAAPQVAAAGVLIKAFYKNQQQKLSQNGGNPDEWNINPWMMESIILESSRHVSTLDQSSRSVRKGRVLDLGGIANYLSQLAGLDFAQRRILASVNDNSEIGAGFTGTNDSGTRTSETGANLIGFDVFARERIINSQDQAQMQAVAYFDNGSSEVVTDKSTFKILSGSATLSSSGILYPKTNYTGAIEVEGNFGTRKAVFKIFSTTQSVISGLATAVPDALEIRVKSATCCYNWIGLPEATSGAGTKLEIAVLAVYADGSRREVTRYSSVFAIDETGLGRLSGLEVPTGLFFGGKPIKITAHYLGVKGQLDYVLPKSELRASDIELRGKLLSDLPVDNNIDLVVMEGTKEYLNTTLTFSKRQNKNLIAGISRAFKKDGELNWMSSVSLEKLPVGIHNYDYYVLYRGNGILEKFSGRVSLEVRADVISDFFALKSTGNDLRTNAIPLIDPFPVNTSYFYAVEERSSGARFVTKNFDAKLLVGGVPSSFAEFKASDNGTSVGNVNLKLYTHAPGVSHSLELTHKTLGKKISVPATYSGSSRRLTFAPGIIKSPLTEIQNQFSSNGWTVQKSTLSDNSEKYRVSNSRTTSSACLSPGPSASGQGTASSPFIICNYNQFVGLLKSLATDRETNAASYFQRFGNPSSVHLHLGNHIEFQNLVELKKVQANSYYLFLNQDLKIDGKGYTFRNLSYLDAEQPFSGIFGSECPQMSNIGFTNMIVSSSYSLLLCNRTYAPLTNIYFQDVSMTGIYEPGVQFSGDVSLVKNLNHRASGILVDGMFKGAGSVAPFESVSQLDTFIISSEVSSQPGAGSIPSFAGVANNINQLASCDPNPAGGLGKTCLEKLASAINGIVNVKIKIGAGYSSSSAGGVASTLFHGLIANVHVKGRVESTSGTVGGLVGSFMGSPYGYHGGIIADSSFTGGVYALDRVGGVAGSSRFGVVQGTSVSGIVSGDEFLGGIAGTNSRFMMMRDNNVSGVNLTSSQARYKGGLVGRKESFSGIAGMVFVPDVNSGNTFSGAAYGNQSEIPSNSQPISSVNE